MAEKERARRLRRWPDRSRRGESLPLPVVLSLLYVGVVRLVLLQLWAQTSSSRLADRGALLQALVGGAGDSGPSWIHLVVLTNLLLVVYLWLAYRSSATAGAGVALVPAIAYGGAGLLLAYLTVAVVSLPGLL